jgi:spermidine synthase
LYTELMIIRVHASSLQLFAYFKNVSLLSCFLGLGVGYTMGARRPLTTPLVLPLLAVQVAFLHAFRFSEAASLLHNPISEQLTLGLRQVGGIDHLAAIYGFLCMVFVFNALTFIPLGHLASRLMMRQRKLLSYGWNLVGSLLGILLFSFISFLWAPPSVWILLLALGLVAFLRSHVESLLPSALAALMLLAFLSVPLVSNQFDVHSPYQILTMRVSKSDFRVLRVNNVYYQRILDLRSENVQTNEYLQQWSDNYTLPYRFKSEPEQVLVVGSGTGNDVAAAIRQGAGKIDAVEIDPAILAFGESLHPESPYQSDKVNVVVNDARAFIRHTDKRYDLIVYGLLDSHTLLSGKSGVRLDSFVYTVEAFREARARLKTDGIVSISFSLIRPELGRKLYLMLQEAFDGQSPIVYRTGYDEGYTFLIGERLTEQARDLPPEFREVTVEFADDALRADKSTDDWPFFYMPVRRYPISYIIVILVLLAISLVFVFQFMPRAKGSFSMPCFFLGAGFMLVETKGITELALVYGSTWIVTSIVVAAILVMAFLSNWLVAKIGAPRPLITYALLFASLLAGLFLFSANLSAFPTWVGQVIMTITLTLPLLFSGFAFSVELAKSGSVAEALSSNLLGGMLGGFLEYNSMYFGFRALYFFALAMYLFAFLGAIRTKK